MKIYNMIEGKWLKSQKEEEDEELKQEEHKDFDVRTRLVTYDEEKEWVRAEKNCVELKKKLDKRLEICYDEYKQNRREK